MNERHTENAARLHIMSGVKYLDTYFWNAPLTSILVLVVLDSMKNSQPLHAENSPLFRQNGMAGYLWQNAVLIIGYSIFCVARPRPAIDAAKVEGAYDFQENIFRTHLTKLLRQENQDTCCAYFIRE